MEERLVSGKIPTYLGVYNGLYSDITGGVYSENEHLPGEAILAERYGVSRNTLRQAMAILCEDGLIARSQGKGTLVLPRKELPVDARPDNPMLSLSKMPVDGVKLQYNYGPPTDIARNKLCLERSDIVLACDVVYRSGGAVIGYSFHQIPTRVFGTLGLDLSAPDAIEELVTRRIFTCAANWSMSIKLVFANEMEREFLDVEEGRPLILLETLLHQSPETPFARCKFYCLPEHYHLQFQI